MPAAVVAHGRADVLGHGAEVRDEVLDGLAPELGMLLDRGVEVVDVRLVVLAVMNLHRLRVDVRFERGEVIGQRGQLMSHL